MYADTITDSMRKAIDETRRRRAIQEKYNEEHHITPQTIHKAVRDLIAVTREVTQEQVRFEKDPESMSYDELKKLIAKVEKQMRALRSCVTRWWSFENTRWNLKTKAHTSDTDRRRPQIMQPPPNNVKGYYGG